MFSGPESKLNLPVTVKNSTWLSVNLGNPFRGQEATTLQLRFSPKKDMNESIVVFHLNVRTSSFQEYDTSTFTSLVIVRRAEVKVVGATAPQVRLYFWTLFWWLFGHHSRPRQCYR